MSKRPRGGRRQTELLPRSKRSTMAVEDNHPLVELTDSVDWTEMERRAERIRASTLKNAAGRPPRLRALLGAMVRRATRRVTYRELEDQIRYYAPARYLCGLTETEWTPDHNTRHDFSEMMGEEGIRLINEYAVEWAVEEKLVSERAKVEEGIGTIKSNKYGFNRPGARSAEMMGTCGQLAVLGFNLTKMVRELAKRKELNLAGS